MFKIFDKNFWDKLRILDMQDWLSKHVGSVDINILELVKLIRDIYFKIYYSKSSWSQESIWYCYTFPKDTLVDTTGLSCKNRPAVNDSVSACCCRRGFEFKSDPHFVIQDMLKWYLVLLCLARDTNCVSSGP